MMNSDDNGVRSVGLDIGTYSIKLAAFALRADKKTLIALNEKKISSRANLDEKTNVIREMFKETDLHPNEVNLSIFGPEAIVRFVNFPKMSRAQLEDALGYEAEKYIPFNMNEVIMDVAILDPIRETEQMRVILAAAKKNAVEELIKICKNLNLEIGVVDMDPFAMFNAFLEVNSVQTGPTFALLNFGHSRTDILVADGKEPVFIRQIPIGGKDISEAIARDVAIEFDAAEKCKSSKTEENSEKILKATFSVLDRLIKEIQLSFGYFENRQRKKIGEIYCSGGMIAQEGVLGYLNEKLNVEIKKWDPTEAAAKSADVFRNGTDTSVPQFAVCMGLALRQP
ncbi:MAG: type IV pilus assembly protein PilM [Candidatus Omnitrophica bacterium]|nr:type IV pilus assembly protein PilM [Candidatus Omnitrophota bacterium]